MATESSNEFLALVCAARLEDEALLQRLMADARTRDTAPGRRMAALAEVTLSFRVAASLFDSAEVGVLPAPDDTFEIQIRTKVKDQYAYARRREVDHPGTEFAELMEEALVEALGDLKLPEEALRSLSGSEFPRMRAAATAVLKAE